MSQVTVPSPLSVAVTCPDVARLQVGSLKIAPSTSLHQPPTTELLTSQVPGGNGSNSARSERTQVSTSLINAPPPAVCVMRLPVQAAIPPGYSPAAPRDLPDRK